MNNIDAIRITQAVEAAFLKANIDVKSVGTYLKSIENQETSSIGKEIIHQIIENADISLENAMPACQDTGMAVVFVEIGQDVHVENGNLTEAINQGVRNAYKKGYFRKSVVDPLSRINTKDNTPAIIHYDIVPGETIKITALPKGFGSENMSDIAMLTPAAGKQGVLDFILKTVKEKGANACPPLVVGVGIGGTFEKCAILSKKSLMRNLNQSSPDPELAEMEEFLLTEINKLGIGPMGLGGKISALAVFIEKFPTHIAGLPVAVNMMCHSLRHETVVVK